MEGPTTKRDFSEKRKSGSVDTLGRLGVVPQKIFVFLCSLDLISCNSSMIFAHFLTKRDFTEGGGGESFSVGGGGSYIGAGPSSIYVKTHDDW